MIRTMIVDDEHMIRAGLRAVLAAAPDIEIVAEGADGHEALELALTHRPDVALLDIRMPRLDGLAAAAELRRTSPATSIVLLTTFSEDEYIAKALDIGLSGFLLKSGDPRELIAAVQAVAAGASFLSPQIAHRVIRQLDGRMTRQVTARTRIEGLSAREREVLAMIGEGLSNAEIAERLFVVEGTVKAYVSSILTRLGMRNRVQVAVLAYEAGLVHGGL